MPNARIPICRIAKSGDLDRQNLLAMAGKGTKRLDPRLGAHAPNCDRNAYI